MTTGDLIIIKTFCEQMSDNDNYPYALNQLSNLSDNIRDTLKGEIQKIKKNHNNSDAVLVESELIIRYFMSSRYRSLKFDIIQGPISVYQMSHDQYPHIFYLFGDIHYKESECTSEYEFIHWLNDTIVNSPVYIDVYIESSYIYKDYKYFDPSIRAKGTYLGDTYDHFKKCFNKKSDKVCQTSRFHYTDIRNTFKSDDEYNGWYIFTKGYLRNDSVWEQKDIPIITRFINNLELDDSVMNVRILKQFDNILDEKIKFKLISRFQACKKSLKKYIPSMNPSNILKIDGGKFNLKKFDDDKFMQYEMCYMDYYLMARSFRNYNQTQKYSRPSYNNVIYAGDEHIDNYINILTSLGFKMGFKYNEDDAGLNQCIDISKMEQPMFYQRYRE